MGGDGPARSIEVTVSVLTHTHVGSCAFSLLPFDFYLRNADTHTVRFFNQQSQHTSLSHICACSHPPTPSTHTHKHTHKCTHTATQRHTYKQFNQNIVLTARVYRTKTSVKRLGVFFLKDYSVYKYNKWLLDFMKPDATWKLSGTLFSCENGAFLTIKKKPPQMSPMSPFPIG